MSSQGPQGRALPVSSDEFRRACGRFATGIAIAGVMDPQDTPHGLTVSSFTSVSLDPVLVLICVEQDARFHDAIEVAGVWGVSVLDESARAVSQWLATRGRPLHGQLDRVPHHRGEVTGVPLMNQSLAALECRTTALHPGGDHTIVVGEVVGVELPDSPGRPLVYHRGAYTHLA